MSEATHLRHWTGALIKEQCDDAYKTYKAARTQQYKAWFTAHPELKDPGHDYKAKDLASALPAGTGFLDAQLPKSERHRHYLSGNSSQVLGLGILGVGARMNPSLQWLFGALGPVKSPASHNPGLTFERKLEASVLGEQPRQTSIDAFVDDPNVLLCAEAKWTEDGMGKCGCADSGGNPAIGNCSALVRSRPKYWGVLGDLGMPDREDGKPCPLSFTYQVVRNIAAARALAQPGQQPVFALLYDAENPYFAGAGEWHGWPAHLKATVDPVFDVTVTSCSWQELTKGTDLDDETIMWAREKHALDMAG